MANLISRDLTTNPDRFAVASEPDSVAKKDTARLDNRLGSFGDLPTKPALPSKGSVPARETELPGLPEEILESIVKFSAPRERGVWAQLNKDFFRIASPHADADVLTIRARAVNTAEGFGATMRLIEALPVSVRRDPLAALANRVQYLPVTGQIRPKAFQDALSAIGVLSPEHQGIPMAQLANTLANIYPKEATPAAYDSVLQAMKHVKNKFPVLIQLISRREFLRGADALAVIPKLLEAIEAMPLHERGQLLAGMTDTVEVIDAIKQLPPHHQVVPLDSLMSGIHLSPQPVVIAAMRAVSELPVEHRDKPEATFADRMRDDVRRQRVFGLLAKEPALAQFAQAMSERPPEDSGPAESCAQM
jgi:hypothetical protein